jgi:hypothetical protein
MKSPIAIIMERKTFIGACLFLLAGFSCTKSDVDLSDKKLSRILLSNGPIAAYSYNADGLVAKTTSYAPPGTVSNERTMHYDNARRLIKVEGAINVSSSVGTPQMDYFYSDYIYENGRVKETKNYHLESGGYVHKSTSAYEYDVNNRVSAITISISNGQSTLKNTYQYDANGNVSVNETFQYQAGAPVLAFRITYEYDDKKNPLAPATVLPFIASKNNVVKETSTSFTTGSAGPVSVLSYNYAQYSRDGYPLLASYGGVEETYEYK